MATTANDPSALTGNTPESPGSEFRLQAPVEIQSVLRELLDRQVPVTLGAANGALLRTRLCALEPAHGAIAFDLPAGADSAAETEALLRADEISATAYLDQIRVQFELDALVQLDSPQGSVLRAALPTQLLRFQRRQAFRVRPASRLPQARLTRSSEGGLPPRLPHQLRIIDLSAGGIALLLPGFSASPWPLGTELAAQVQLNRDISFEALLRLQHIQAHAERPDTPEPRPDDPDSLRLGCAWASIGASAERQLQQFIDQTQKINRLMQQKQQHQQQQQAGAERETQA